jgi:hypothetical protein
MEVIVELLEHVLWQNSTKMGEHFVQAWNIRQRQTPLAQFKFGRCQCLFNMGGTDLAKFILEGRWKIEASENVVVVGAGLNLNLNQLANLKLIVNIDEELLTICDNLFI